MRVCSIDVGIRNLAYCVVERGGPEQKDIEIRAWRLLGFAGKTMADTVHGLHSLLVEHAADFEGCRDVLIERQAGLNKTMITISHALQMHFLDRRRRVHFCDPRNKLKAFEGLQGPESLPKDRYACTKALSRFHVRNAVRDLPEWSAFLSENSKTDDLTVSCLQQTASAFHVC